MDDLRSIYFFSFQLIRLVLIGSKSTHYAKQLMLRVAFKKDCIKLWEGGYITINTGNGKVKHESGGKETPQNNRVKRARNASKYESYLYS